MSDAALHQLSYIPEVTRGTMPTTPAMQIISHKGWTFGKNRTPIQPGKVRADRQITDYRLGVGEVPGELDTGGLTYGEYDDLFANVLGGAWASDVLVAGVARSSFTFEEYFADQASGDNPYHRCTALEFFGFELDVKIGAEVGCKFSGLAWDYATDSAIITGETYTAEADVEAMDSLSGAVKEGGSAIALLTGIKLKLDNSGKSRHVLGSAVGIKQSIGLSNCTGEITAYFENDALLQKFLQETESSIEFTLNDPAGNSYDILVPRVKYNKGDKPVNGSGDIIITLPFQALRDSVTSTNLKITRAAA